MPQKEIITHPQIAQGSNPLSQATRFGDMVFVQAVPAGTPPPEKTVLTYGSRPGSPCNGSG